MYGVGDLVTRYRARNVFGIAVVISVAVVTCHRNVQIIEHSARVAVKEEAVHLRTVSRLHRGCKISRGVGDSHHGNGLCGIGGVNYMYVLIEIDRSSVGVNAVCDRLGNGIFYLGVLAACINLAAFRIPRNGRTVGCLIKRYLARSVGAHPLNEPFSLGSAEIVVPVLNDLLKRTVSTVLIRLKENVIEAYITARGNYVIIVIYARGEYGIRKIRLISYLDAQTLNGPIKSGRYRLPVVQIVKDHHRVSAIKHRADNVGIIIRANAYSLRINNVNDYRGTVISRSYRSLAFIIVDRKLHGNTYVTVVTDELCFTDLFSRKFAFDRFHRIGRTLARTVCKNGYCRKGKKSN